MQWLAALAVRRSVFATVLVLLLCVMGVAGYSKLGVDRFPKVDSPRIVVLTELPGAAPHEVETEITDLLEEAVNTVGGIDDLRSVSSEGVSQIFVTFVTDKDTQTAAQEVRERVDSVLSELPAGTRTPEVLRFSSDSYPVVYAVVNGPGSLATVTEVADKQIRQRLEGSPGVGQVTLLGGSKRRINVWLDAERLRAFGLTALDVQRSVTAAHVALPAGRLEAGPEQQLLRVQGRVTAPDELAGLPVRDEAGRRVLLGDVAEIDDGTARAQSAALRDGKRAVLLAIRKQDGANAIAMVDELRYRLSQLSLPAGFAVEVIRDATVSTRSSVRAVLEHLLAGSLLTALVVLGFLGSFRSTFIAALAIPTSIIGTFGAMWLAGLTIDTVTLLALALAVGIVIDDAIIVLENIERTIDIRGLPPVRAALVATREIGPAVLATTLSLVAVFAPIAFMTGLVGQFLKSFGLTMVFAIVLSAGVSFVLTPMLSSRLLGPRAPSDHHPATQGPLKRWTQRTIAVLERRYESVLRRCMRRRWLVVLVALAALGAIVPLALRVPAGFLPRSDEAEFEVRVRAPEGSSLEMTTLSTERIARAVRGFAEVTGTVVTVGDNAERAENLATILVELGPPELRRASQAEIMERVRAEIVRRQPKDLRIQVADVPLLSGGAAIADIEFSLRGPDLERLAHYSNELVRRFRKVAGAADVNSSYIVGKPELGLRIDRDRAAELGVRADDVAATLGLFVGGVEAAIYEESGERYPIFLRGRASQRADYGDLELLAVPSASLGSVPLSEVVTSHSSLGPASIERLDRGRHVVLTANLAAGAAANVVTAAFEREISQLGLPADYRCVVSGQSREMERTMSAFLLAFLLSFVFMYLVLAAQFESWLQPITMLLALPLSLPFALVSLLLLRQQLDIYSMLGLLVLFGMVKKNSILQVDHANQLRRQGVERIDAYVLASRDRLRPILMTTFAFVVGMLPLLFSRGVGAGFNQAIAGVIVGGQVLSLALTLLATPVFHSLFDDLARVARRRSKPSERRRAIDGELAQLEAERLNPPPHALAGS